MFYNGETFYFATQRKIVAAFGTLFNNLTLGTYNGNGGRGGLIKTRRVPFSYGPSQKWMKLQSEYSRTGDTVRLQNLLPRASFELVDIEYDANRKLTTVGMNTTYITDSNSLTSFFKQLQPVPYNFTFEVHLITKKIDDALQLQEQILCYFTPSYQLTIKDIPELGISRDVAVKFVGIKTDNPWDGDPKDTAVITTTLTFLALGYIYPPVTNTAVIKEIIAKINQYSNTDTDNPDATVTISVDPIDAGPDDDWEAKVEIEE